MSYLTYNKDEPYGLIVPEKYRGTVQNIANAYKATKYAVDTYKRARSAYDSFSPYFSNPNPVTKRRKITPKARSSSSMPRSRRSRRPAVRRTRRKSYRTKRRRKRRKRSSKYTKYGTEKSRGRQFTFAQLNKILIKQCKEYTNPYIGRFSGLNNVHKVRQKMCIYKKIYTGITDYQPFLTLFLNSTFDPFGDGGSTVAPGTTLLTSLYKNYVVTHVVAFIRLTRWYDDNQPGNASDVAVWKNDIAQVEPANDLKHVCERKMSYVILPNKNASGFGGGLAYDNKPTKIVRISWAIRSHLPTATKGKTFQEACEATTGSSPTNACKVQFRAEKMSGANFIVTDELEMDIELQQDVIYYDLKETVEVE